MLQKIKKTGHFSFGVFLLDFVVFSEQLSQSWVASIVTDLASLTFLTNSAFSSFLRYVTFISSSTSRSSVGQVACVTSLRVKCANRYQLMNGFCVVID